MTVKKYTFVLLFGILFINAIHLKASGNKLRTGADRLEIYYPIILNKNVALVVNQTSVIGNKKVHLVDSLLSLNISVKKIFAPEHGFRGEAEAGETVGNNKDKKTGLPIISLFGKNKKPLPEQLTDVDVIIFDIQDVGARFFTYISTMHYVMEACAENNKLFLVLDRPNPNDFIDGPILETEQRSFVGMHPIPVLHGLTVGELAGMINGENWLTEGQCRLTIIKCTGWKHGQPYVLPIPPSPNLPNAQAVALYPSLCFFEATQFSVGRGTSFPFQVVGFPNKKYGSFSFTPKSLPGFSANPLQKNKLCYGLDLRKKQTTGGLTLEYFLDFYKKSGLEAKFFSSPSFMDRLAGTSLLRKQILQGKTEKEIRESWEKGLNEYKLKRKKYLLYPD